MKFSLGDVLTITTGKLVSRTGIDAIYKILNYMTGDNLFTHQLPRGMEECAPWLLRWYPALAEIQVPEFDQEDIEERKTAIFAWVDSLVPKYGAELEVKRIPQDDHDQIDPVTELEGMIGKDRVIVVDPDEISEP